MGEWVAGITESGWSTLAIAIGLLVVNRAFLSTGPVAVVRAVTESKPPEGGLWYDVKQVERYLDKPPVPHQKPLWVWYRRALALDIPFAVLYGVALIFIVEGTLGHALADRSGYLLRWFPPALAAVADLFEDVFLLKAVRSDDGQLRVRKWGVNAARPFTVIKWTAVLVTFALVVAGVIALGLRGAGSYVPKSIWTLLAVTLLPAAYPLFLAWRRSARSFGSQVFFAFVNIGVGAIVFLLLFPEHLTQEEAGLVPFLWDERSEGAWWGGSIAAVLIAAMLLATLVPGIRARFADCRYVGWKWWEVALKVPLIVIATAAFEEFLFRGVIFVVWLDVHPAGLAIVGSSIAFGLWHVGAEIERFRINREERCGGSPATTTGEERHEREQRTASILYTVLFTTAAGVLFAAVRYASESVWPVVIIHAGINVWSFFLAVSATRNSESLSGER